MPTMVLPECGRVLGAVAVLVSLTGCAASSSAPPARVPAAKSFRAQSSPVAPANPGPISSDASQRAALAESVTDSNFETFQLTIEGAGDPPLLPCNLRLKNEAGSMVLDFHAERSSVPRIREQTQELSVYLNRNRGDEQATRMPNGRPDPETFPIREILRTGPIASVEDLPDGARLTLTPNGKTRGERLRAEVLWHAGDLLPGLPFEGKTCPELPARLQAAAEPPAATP
ncbi:MAG TPA: hypothetical protein VK524_24480 [Polyangiaceae bacterium]|nr:hypothetical protein [Polyangiaceae bacterium]